MSFASHESATRQSAGDAITAEDIRAGGAKAPEDVARFPKLDLVSIEDFGGWKKVQPEHFGDGGIFDQIYQPK